MNDTVNKSEFRRQRLLKRVRKEARAEYDNAGSQLRRRRDHHPVWDYFQDLLVRPLTPDTLREAVGVPIIKHLCNQAPFELIHAMGLHPFRLSGGCFAVNRLMAEGFPVLMCPMLKSSMGMHHLIENQETEPDTWVIPTTCDWVVKFREMSGDTMSPACFMELPHLRQTEKGQKRWLEEIYDLKRFLEKQTGRKLKRRNLLSSVQTFMQAWSALGKLIELRRKGRVSGVRFMAVVNSFMLDSVEVWTEHVNKALDVVMSEPTEPTGKCVFLAGSPIVFPNFKMPDLIESAGMTICGDDLCTSERIWPGAYCYEDPSLHGLLRALAERYHKGSICPTFADNERRVNNILNVLKHHPHIRAVVYHILKGCHPFDIEGFELEKRLKSEGYGFIKIETDYVMEDAGNILTRLEAFSRI